MSVYRPRYYGFIGERRQAHSSLVEGQNHDQSHEHPKGYLETRLLHCVPPLENGKADASIRLRV